MKTKTQRPKQQIVWSIITSEEAKNLKAHKENESVDKNLEETLSKPIFEMKNKEFEVYKLNFMPLIIFLKEERINW